MEFPDKYRAAPGQWALVTGAAGGIGFAFARRLAALGYGLALADIDFGKLSVAADDLRSRYGVDVRTLAIDLSRIDAAGRLHDWCAGESVTPLIVVNNAGVFSYNDIIATDPARIEAMAGLHVTTVLLICRHFADDMARRGKGYILNMSSYSLWMPWPGLAVYSATKACIRNFSLALGVELRESGVSVTAVMPAGVTTGLYGLSPRLQTAGRRLGILLTPERTAEKALRAMFRDRRQYVPGFAMRLLLPVVRALPRWAIRLARRKTLRFQK